MNTKLIPLGHLPTDLETTLTECADSGTKVIVELPDHRRVSIQPVNGTADDDLAPRFRTLADTWKRETLYLSSVTKKATPPAYQSIIGLGKDAVPLILTELRNDPADWFWALTAITGENPSPQTSAGNMQEMADAWLRWGHEHGFTLEPTRCACDP